MLAQSCPTLCDLMDCSPPGSSVHGILQARILEWVAISSSRDSFWPRDQSRISWVSCIAVRFFTTWAIGKALIRDMHTRYLIHRSDILLLSCACVHQATYLGYFSVSTVRTELPRAENHSEPSGPYQLSSLSSPHPPDSSCHTPVTGLPSVCKAVLQHPLKAFRRP